MFKSISSPLFGGFKMSYLSKCRVDEAQKVMKHCQELRQTYRHHSSGYTKDRTMRHILSFEPEVIFHPEFSKYFDKEMDPHERKKHLYDFARKHPEYVVVDKY